MVSELLSCVSDGVKLGDFLVKFTLTESTLDKLVSMDANQKLAWVKIMVRKTVFFGQFLNCIFQGLVSGEGTS